MGRKDPHWKALICVSCLMLLQGCAANEIRTEPSLGEQLTNSGAWPTALPVDALQPWEVDDDVGMPIFNVGRSATAINGDSEFVPGVERYQEGGGITGNGEALTISSSAGSASYAVYRIPQHGEVPGVISVDANVLAGAGYYVGLADYGRNRWAWHGPFTDNHVRLSTAGGDYLSNLGNLFICIVAWDTAGADVVGVGSNAIDSEDTTAPPIPQSPEITEVNGGLYLQWLPVAAGDLAGYVIYYCSTEFNDQQAVGVSSSSYLEGGTHHVLTGLTEKTYVRLSAVDFSGNESELSASASGMPQSGAVPQVNVATSAASAMLHYEVSLTATGAELYDFDVDGNGIYDITGDPSGIASIDTSATGLIRPFAYGYSESGTAVSCGGVSLIVSSNSRPVACATATPSSGTAPLEVSFAGAESTDFDGTIVGGGWDFDGDGVYDIWAEEDTVHVTAAVHIYPAAGNYNAKLRVVDDQGAWDVDTVNVSVGEAAGNIPPVAVLYGSDFSGSDSLDVLFSAADSYDEDGSIVDIEWDLDGNGLFNETGDEFNSRGMVEPPIQTYTAGPPLVVKVRVTDDDDGTDVARFTVTVHGLLVKIVTYEYQIGTHTSLALVDTRPAISYYNITLSELEYVRATDRTGNNWGTPITVDTDGSVGQFSSLAVIDGNPAISYLNLSNSSLQYVRAVDTTGSTWGAPVIVDGPGVGQYTDLAVVDGSPAISYYDISNGELKYARALDSTGVSWGTPVVVDAEGFVGEYTSLVVVNGNPAISYRDQSDQDLMYARAADAQGTAWDTPIEVVTVGAVGRFSSMAVVAGHPAISYYDDTDYNLNYVRALDSNGNAWGAPLALDTPNSVGLFTSLAVVAGKPAISYFDATNDDLKYVQAINSTGEFWNSPVQVDTTGDVGEYTSLIDIDGYPAISYYAFTGVDLKFARKF